MRALLFPGQGAQKVGMGETLYHQEILVREVFEEASEVLGYSMSTLCFSDPQNKLNLTEYTQPALLCLSYAITRLMQAEGVSFQAAAGLSLGEYTALLYGGHVDFATAIKLVSLRGRFMQEAVSQGSGIMVAILGMKEHEIQGILKDYEGRVIIANYNTPMQFVIAGEEAATREAAKTLKAKGAKKTTELAVSAPFHTHYLKPAADKLLPYLKQVQWQSGSVKVFSNLDGGVYHQDYVERLYRQIFSPVRWYQELAVMKQAGFKDFVEVGPGDTLSKMMKRIDADLTIQNIQSREEIHG